MGAQPTPRAILFDCLGTLLRLEPPAPRLRAAVRSASGIDVGDDDAAAAMRAEIAHYRANLQRARDAESLAAVRAECAAVVSDVLGVEVGVQTLLAAIEFTPFDEVAHVLRTLRERGVRLAVVSNWDVSLHEVLARTRLRASVDAVVSSAEVGAAKPDPAPFAAALAELRVAPADAWHVGDSPAEDVAGAEAAGITPVLIARDGAQAPVRTIASLTSLLDG